MAVSSAAVSSILPSVPASQSSHGIISRPSTSAAPARVSDFHALAAFNNALDLQCYNLFKKPRDVLRPSLLDVEDSLIDFVKLFLLWRNLKLFTAAS